MYEDYGSSLFSTGALLLVVVFYVVEVIALWKMFQKAGIDGWKAIIPFMNSYYLFKLSMGNGWLFLLTFIPCVGFIVNIIQSLRLADVYGQSTLFGILAFFFAPIVYLIIGFSNNIQYVGIPAKTS